MRTNHRKPWTELDRSIAIRLNNDGKTDKEIGKVLGRTELAITNHFIALRAGPEKMAEYAKNRSPKIQCSEGANFIYMPEDETVSHRPTPEMIADRDRRLALPAQSITASFFGDPPRGLSALDRRGAR